MLKSKFKLGEILIKEKLINEALLEKAIQVQTQEGGRLGEVLIKLGILKEEDIMLALAKQLNIPYASFASGLLTPTPDQGLENIITRETAMRLNVIPISKNLNSLTVAVIDPLDLLMLDNLKRISECDINPIIATKTDILKAIAAFYKKKDLLAEAVDSSYDVDVVDLELKPAAEEGQLNLDKVIAEASEAPVVKLVDLLIKRAIDDRASDIHIEPLKDGISLRCRIDGILYEISPPAKQLMAPLVSRVKILSKLDIAEKRLPQDGGFVIKMAEDKVIDVRVSSIPTIYGEKVVMRLLDKSVVPLDLGRMGFEQKALDDFRKVIRQPYGLILLTGPTGSGKTTTLYAALNEIKSAAKNVITIEDPVEYRLDGINQVQAKPNIGLTFANGLRAFLRQDPDIIMVGEVRDLETAQICVRASLTGHLVLSTLHTNDSAGAISRMMDIGIEPYLLVSSLTLVGAQRLVRKLCPECKEAYEVTPQIQEKIFIKQELLYKAKGCDKCNQVGYRGRMAIYEILPVTEKMKELIYKRATPQVIKQSAREQGMRSLWESGLKKVEEGITSLEEVMSITLGSDS